MSGDPSSPDAWVRIRVEAPADPHLRELWIEVLMDHLHQGVAVEDGALVGYFPASRSEGARELDRLQALRRALGELPGADRALRGLDVAHVDHEEWADVWRAGFRPRRITHRLLVVPSWSDVTPGEGDVLLTLDPGMAFGTAEHATTRGCLRLLDPRVLPGSRVADVGAGSGILSIASALLGADEVLAVELDPWSAEVARENAELNGVGHQVEVRAGRVGPEGLPGEAPFDGLVSNIEAGVLLGLLPGLASSVLPGGWVLLSGILQHEVADVLAVARELGLEPDGDDLEDGWWSGAFRVVGPSPTSAPSA